jgi:DsbC/DsbD-like thiol-disulfide interchange protein
MKTAHTRHNTASFARALMLGGILGCCLGAARADDVSAWDTDIRSSLRLIAGSSLKDGGAPMLRAGIQLRLDPGWKTYWRYPGDSGVPPRFNFDGSENVKSVTVLWPAPRRFPDGAGGHSIGYTEAVIFPVHVVPQEANKPVTLRLKADYAICEKLCVPAEGKADLKLTPGAAAEESALAAAEARVPKPLALGKGDGMTIRAARRELSNGRPRVVVDVAVPEGANVDLFAEGPTPDWALPLPELVAGAPAETRRFAFEVDGVPPGTSIEGVTLKLTLVAGEQAVEVSTHLD